MRQLFWKECYELRYLPLGAALAVAVLLAADRAYNHYDGVDIAYKSEFLQYLMYVWLLFATLAGSGTISQEIGSGTLQFLSSLPVKRRTLWWVKAIVSSGMLLISILASGLTWMLLCEVWYSDKPLPNTREVWMEYGLTPIFTLSTFAVAMAVSTLVDRTISAAVVSIIGAMGVWVLSEAVVPLLTGTNYESEPVLGTLIGLSIPSFVAISYWTFTRGETLRGPRRFIVAGITGGVCFGISLLILAIATALGAWQPQQ